MTMLLSDYCFEINTHGIKKSYAIQTIGLITAALRSPGMHFKMTTPKIFALADGRNTLNTLKENQFCSMVWMC